MVQKDQKLPIMIKAYQVTAKIQNYDFLNI